MEKADISIEKPGIVMEKPRITAGPIELIVDPETVVHLGYTRFIIEPHLGNQEAQTTVLCELSFEGWAMNRFSLESRRKDQKALSRGLRRLGFYLAHANQVSLKESIGNYEIHRGEKEDIYSGELYKDKVEKE